MPQCTLRELRRPYFSGKQIRAQGSDSARGLGETAALDTVEKRKGKTFTSVEEFSMCCNKLSQTHIDQLRALGAFAGLPETSQLTLF